MYNKKIVCLLLVLCALLLPGCANTEALDTLLRAPVAAEDSYTPNSYAEYVAALEAANAVLSEQSPKRGAVNAATERLQQSMDGLLLRADKTELEAILAEARGIDRSIYLPISVEGLDAAVQSADTIIADLNALDADVSEALKQLEDSMAHLEQIPDKSALEELLNTSSGYAEEKYTTGTFSSLKNAISQGEKSLADENATQSDVNAAVALISKSIENLELRPDNTKLAKLVEKASGYKEEKYTTVSYDKLDAALSNAKTVLNNQNATQAAIDDATANLQNAVDSLKKCTKCVWEIRVSLYMVSNNSVGNDWDYGIYYNGNAVQRSFEVTKSAGSTISIKGKAVENDSVPDSGSGTLSLKLTDGNEKSITFSVRENRGRYSGNTAVWELTASCTIIERV